MKNLERRRMGSGVRVMTEQGNERIEVAEIQLANRLSELDRLHAFFDGIGHRSNWTDRLRWDLTLSCEELLTNTITYGYPQGGDHLITLAVNAEPGRIEVKLEDDAIPFNPLEQDEPDITLSVEDRAIGGLGIFFVKRMMNEIIYERTLTGNRLTLRKIW
ncbi:ATP-binding protein [Cohnella silvisoli]|uniref:ATP-binding protein n=1 Tax=Cohnella silvisoli TaxID=2873699 RepID=A0ABV1L2W2_9BACL|nr:ATP-binding protein [Cohnella silvisoli]MCD9025845.1 ATP-binding protein [Cohnella silvisoli]